MNIRLMSLLAFSLAGLFAANSAAVTVFECEDENGNRSFQDRCPPGTTPVSEKEFNTGAKETAKPDVAITLYSTPTCDACDVARSYLVKRGAVFTEKNVENNVDLQTELMEKSGAVRVPTILIGDEIITGFDKLALKKGLDEAGYAEASADAEATAAEQLPARPPTASQ